MGKTVSPNIEIIVDIFELSQISRGKIKLKITKALKTKENNTIFPKRKRLAKWQVFFF
ncbi:hypothetical protein ACIQAA_06565 [Neobacillus sp. NPDC093182]|uniref:hypothetical protein n=1 Tax=Neobacillus sp. NPDC093182 TaxID=3364297 RepID=UPI0038254240